MSSTERPALGSRENHWGAEDVEETAGHDPNPDANSWIERTAHKILKQRNPKLCPIELNEDPGGELHDRNGERELSDPEIHVPVRVGTGSPHAERDVAVKPNRRRFNPKHGYVVDGPVIGDAEVDTLLASVEEVLEAAYTRTGLSEHKAAILLEDAERMKRQTDKQDTEILETILWYLTHPVTITEDRDHVTEYRQRTA